MANSRNLRDAHAAFIIKPERDGWLSKAHDAASLCNNIAHTLGRLASAAELMGNATLARRLDDLAEAAEQAEKLARNAAHDAVQQMCADTAQSTHNMISAVLAVASRDTKAPQ